MAIQMDRVNKPRTWGLPEIRVHAEYVGYRVEVGYHLEKYWYGCAEAPRMA
jgi:hypothetical protein